MPTDADYSINDLARLTGLNVRTIRYWIAQGMLPASGESGPGAHYGQGHLDRLRLIKRLQAEYLPNAEIRRRLAPLSDAEVAALITEPAQADPERPTTSALEYVRGLLGGAATAALTTPALAAAPTPPTPSAPAPPTPSAPTPPTPSAPTPSAPTPSSTPPAFDLVSEESMPIAAYPPRFRLAASGPAPAGVRSIPARRDPASADATAVATPDPATTYAAIGIGNAESRAGTAAPGTTAPGTHTSPQPERSQWERLSLGENIELHIRRPLSRPEQRRVERLITIARQVLDEDKA